MLSEQEARAIASSLETARTSRQQIRQLSRQFPELVISDAYKIQREWLQLRLEQGRRVVGHKIGLTSRAMQQVALIDEPDFAPLLEDMFLDAGDLLMKDFILPRVEVELGFVLARPLAGSHLTISEVLSATEYVQPMVEIIDARIEQLDREQQTPRTVIDTIADFAACAGVVRGGRRAAPHEFDLRWLPALLIRNDVVEETGVAAGVLDHPARGVAWLAAKLSTFGEKLEAGETVLSGSFTRAIPARCGDQFTADYGPLGQISFAFA